MHDPKREAVKWLRAELAHLEAQALAPSQQAIIRRLLWRAVECGPILRDIWSPAHLHPTQEGRGGGRVDRIEPGPNDEPIHRPSAAAHLEAIATERQRILQTLILTAADAPGRAAAVREERRDLPDLLRKFAHHVDEARRTLERIQTHAARAGLSLPGPLVDIPDLIEQAAAAGGPESCGLVQPELSRLAGQFLQHWPDPAALLQAMATAADGGPEPGLYPITRQPHALNDFTRALAVNLAAVWPTLEALQPWEFKHGDLAAFAAACL